MRKLVLFGNGAVASLMHYYFMRETTYSVVAFTVDRPFISEDARHGVPVIPWDEVAKVYPANDHDMMIAVGFARANRLRAERYAEARGMGYRIASYVSPSAMLWDGFVVGENCRIAENVVIQPFATIGNNVFVGSGSIIGHHSRIDDHCHLSASVRMAGEVSVASYCYIGVNATIRNKVRIARSCVIGAGAVVLDDTAENGVYMAHAADVLPISSEKLLSA